MATITIMDYLAMPQSERPEVRYRNDLVDSIHPHPRGDGTYVICQSVFSHGNKRPDTLLQIWQSEDVREELVSVQGELASIYYDVHQEYDRARRTPANDWEEKYWQGKKDGMRIALAALNELMPDGHDWEGLQESSQKGRATALQIMTSQVNDAVRIFDNILDTGLDRENKRELDQFIKWIETVKRDFGINYEDKN